MKRIPIDTVLFRSSSPEVFCKKSVLRNFAKFTGKHLCQSISFNKVAGLISGIVQKFFENLKIYIFFLH